MSSIPSGLPQCVQTLFFITSCEGRSSREAILHSKYREVKRDVGLIPLWDTLSINVVDVNRRLHLERGCQEIADGYAFRRI